VVRTLPRLAIRAFFHGVKAWALAGLRGKGNCAIVARTDLVLRRREVASNDEDSVSFTRLRSRPKDSAVQHRHRATPVKEKAKTSRASYDRDVILWSEEQARLLRAQRFSELDLEHLADEIEDVGRSEKRELANRMAVLLAHLLKWRSQRDNRTNSWRATINDHRRRIALAIKETPSLKAVMRVADWREGVWLDARGQARKEMGLTGDDLPEACPWPLEQAVDPEFWPE
jgi:hypothetical protein